MGEGRWGVSVGERINISSKGWQRMPPEKVMKEKLLTEMRGQVPQASRGRAFQSVQRRFWRVPGMQEGKQGGHRDAENKERSRKPRQIGNQGAGSSCRALKVVVQTQVYSLGE